MPKKSRLDGMVSRDPSDNNRGSDRYTPEVMAAIAEGRQAGMTWVQITVSLGWPKGAASAIRDYAINRGAIPRRAHVRVNAKPEKVLSERESWGWDSLPAGHPLAMAVLEGARVRG